MPEITRDQVAHLARLSRLALDDDELDGLAAQLDVILGAVAADLARSPTPPTCRRRPTRCRSRTSRGPTSSGRRCRARTCSPARPAAEDGRFRVPRILDDEA